jgi:hypothetical protein
MSQRIINLVEQTKTMHESIQRQVRLLSLAALVAALCLPLAGCGNKAAKSPDHGTTAGGSIANNSQASAALKAQAAQQQQLGQREQMLMQQAHHGPTSPATK